MSTQRSAVGASATSVVLRVVNKATTPVQLTLSAAVGGSAVLEPQSMTVLEAPSGADGLFTVNSGRQPELVKPRTVAVAGKGRESVEIPAQSFVVLVYTHAQLHHGR